MRKTLLIITLGVAHAMLGFTLFLAAFGAGMARFDTGRLPSPSERVLDAIVAVFQFPLITLAMQLPASWLPGLWGHFLSVLNGILCASIMVGVWTWLRPQRAPTRA